uniref:Angiomotin like 2b n=1 Tax=Neogobius melanostomus TaxID=47308 RepID=A0A8C6TH84_9GOBI
MSSTEEPSGTVLHRLIQEQLRYGNPTDTRTLLAIQQQALRGGSGSAPSSGGDMSRSPRSSLESLTQEEPSSPQLSARQEPQGQEHHGDYQHSESPFQLLQLHGEELPTYDQAKVYSQYLASHWAPTDPGLFLLLNLTKLLFKVQFFILTLYLVLNRFEQAVEVPCYSSLHSLPPAGLEEPNQVELLLMENERLRQELEVHREKGGRIQKLEQEIQRISEAYETLMKGSTKRETLEQTLRRRLVAEVRRLQDFNRDLRGMSRKYTVVMRVKMREEQNSERERMERELQRLRGTAEEQNLKAKRLEDALESAQGRGRQLEEELRRKRAYVEKVERLQSALAQLQSTCEKRESLEMRLRTRLEQELRTLRAQQRQTQPPGTTMSSLQEHLQEKEERILALEADMVRWEQKYLEESTMRQFAMEVAATAAAQRDTTIINHSPCHSSNNSFNEDLPPADYRNQEMENRIRTLYAQILEKDAVIKILNQRLHQDQGKKEERPSKNLYSDVGAPLRPASSTPVISTVNTQITILKYSRVITFNVILFDLFINYLSVKSLSDDQTLPNRQFSAQSEPGTLERPVTGIKAKLTSSQTKLNTGEFVFKYPLSVCARSRFGGIPNLKDVHALINKVDFMHLSFILYR